MDSITQSSLGGSTDLDTIAAQSGASNGKDEVAASKPNFRPKVFPEFGADGVPLISKNARKKAARLMRLKQSRMEKKLRKKEQKRKEEGGGQTKRKGEDEEGDNGPSKRSTREKQLQDMRRGLLSGQRIAIDLRYDSLMSDKELVHLARQICRVYGINRSYSEGSTHIYLVNMAEESPSYKMCCRKNDGFDKYLVDRTGKDLLEVFKSEEIIYLSPDAKEPMTDVEGDKVYVIGGLSDDSVKKNQTCLYTGEKGLVCRRLPIPEYCEKMGSGSYSQILSINAVFEVLVTFIKCHDWAQAFRKGLPARFGWHPKQPPPEEETL